MFRIIKVQNGERSLVVDASIEVKVMLTVLHAGWICTLVRIKFHVLSKWYSTAEAPAAVVEVVARGSKRR